MNRDPVPPQLADLLTRYLQSQASAHAEGLAFAETGEVVPHEAAPVQPVDPKLAWDGALAAASCFVPGAEVRSLQAPPDWPALVASHEPETALAFCIGNFPQLVRDLHPLLQTTDLTTLRRPGGRAAVVPALLDWIEQTARKGSPAQVLVAGGALRLARQFDRAAELFRKHQSSVSTEWQPCWANERAALAWHCGQEDEALALWLAEPETAPVLFNRGMAMLFLGRATEARSSLSRAVQQLPADSAWHHLGRLYLALAEMRG
jgi:hypothetical protein